METMYKQQNLFSEIDENNDWEKEWVGMPEFVQEDLTSFRKIVVHFRSQEDLDKFAIVINQKITLKQPSLWYPEMQPRRYAHLRYIKKDE